MCCCVAADSRRQRSIPRIFFFHSSLLGKPFFCIHMCFSFHLPMDRAGRQCGSAYLSFDGLVLRLCVSQLNAGKFCGWTREGVCAGRHFDLGFSGNLCLLARKEFEEEELVIMLLLRGAGDVSQCLASFILFPRRVDEQTRKREKKALLFFQLMMINKRPCQPYMYVYPGT